MLNLLSFRILRFCYLRNNNPPMFEGLVCYSVPVVYHDYRSCIIVGCFYLFPLQCKAGFYLYIAKAGFSIE